MTASRPREPLAARIPEALKPGLGIVSRLREAGWETYLVGGVVRDLLLGRPPADLDIVTAAPPEAVARLFDRTVPVGAAFGVTAVVVDGRPYQVAAFRREGPYRDGRRPAYVRPADARTDALRRDFTVNALLYDPLADEVIDHVGGLDDLARGLIRTVGEPRARFQEDRLRMLRAVRLSAELGFALDPATAGAIRELAGAVQEVSGERVRDELLRLLVAPERAAGVRLLREVGLLAPVLPELAAADRVVPGGRTVWDVVVGALERLHRPSPPLALATLLHRSEAAAEGICGRLRLSTAQRRLVLGLVRHWRAVEDLPRLRSAAVRRLVQAVRPADLLELYRVATAAAGGDLGSYVRGAEVIAARACGGAPLLTGRDLIAMGYPPGPPFAEMLQAVEDARERGEIATPRAARAWLAARFPIGGGQAGAVSQPAEPSRRRDGRADGGADV